MEHKDNDTYMQRYVLVSDAERELYERASMLQSQVARAAFWIMVMYVLGICFWRYPGMDVVARHLIMCVFVAVPLMFFLVAIVSAFIFKGVPQPKHKSVARADIVRNIARDEHAGVEYIANGATHGEDMLLLLAQTGMSGNMFDRPAECSDSFEGLSVSEKWYVAIRADLRGLFHGYVWRIELEENVFEAYCQGRECVYEMLPASKPFGLPEQMWQEMLDAAAAVGGLVALVALVGNELVVAIQLPKNLLEWEGDLDEDRLRTVAGNIGFIVSLPERLLSCVA